LDGFSSNQGELYMVNDGMDGFTGLMEFITGILDLGDEVINGSFCGAAGLAGTGHTASAFSRFKS
jgi:hypothetical protein